MIPTKDSMGDTPLLWAAKEGHEEVVRALLERNDINPNKPGIHGRTPLSWAALHGHEEVVKMIMQWKDGRTAMPDDMN